MVDDKAIDFETIESLFFAYRDFVSDPDAILAKLGYGRAHHRVVHFVSRRPGMTVADLLAILQITKQSLARVLKELIDSGYIRQMAGPADRRQRRLYPTLAVANCRSPCRSLNPAHCAGHAGHEHRGARHGAPLLARHAEADGRRSGQ